MLNSIFGLISPKNRVLKKAEKIARAVDGLSEKYRNLSDEELKQENVNFINEIANGKNLDDILVPAFALIREVIYRETKEYAFLVQLMGAYVVHQGDFAEMVTGEGKTLTLVIAAYLNALEKKGVHIVTVNEYLASRDAAYASRIFKRLGLTVGCNYAGLAPFMKKQAFDCDLTYTTNSELGFDYLRDNMVFRYSDKKIRSLNFAIVDEGDSVLIDEARTPLIISGQPQHDVANYLNADKFVASLSDDDYKIDPETRSPMLTDSGIKKAEKFFGLKNLFNIENSDIFHKIGNALTANYVFENGREYIVRNNKILIVDQFTGRVLEGRSYNAGLHQAIQVKERVEIEPENLIIATITYQSFFRLYRKLAAVSGTAATESEEFLKIYNMLVVPIPTNKPIIRKDKSDYIFGNLNTKWKAVVEEIVKIHKTHQPILVGTGSVEDSELLSKKLRQVNIPHTILNAKNNTKEAEIVKLAGQKDAVTISTNMAGRGTDIKLGDGVKELGGLYVIGTERHESRRIDNQLRGRSGRQGDPGISRFFISYEDPLFKRFAHDKVNRYIAALGDDYYNSRLLTKSLNRTQKIVESRNFDTRKNLIDYDHVLANQRELIYKQRDQILKGNNLFILIKKMLHKVVTEVFKKNQNLQNSSLVDNDNLFNDIRRYLLPEIELPKDAFKNVNIVNAIDYLFNLVEKTFRNKLDKFPQTLIDNIIREVVIQQIDNYWIYHLDKMLKLREGVHLRSYEQTSPLNIYIKESDLMFNNMLNKIAFSSVRMFAELKVPNAQLEKQVNVVNNDESSTDNKELKSFDNNSTLSSENAKSKLLSIVEEKKVENNQINGEEIIINSDEPISEIKNLNEESPHFAKTFIEKKFEEDIIERIEREIETSDDNHIGEEKNAN